MGSHSKQKGAQFERDVCKALSLWVSSGAREDLFWRSAMSGGRATVGSRKGLDLTEHAGDISATHKDGHSLTDYWYVECKRYGDLKIESALLDGTGTLMQQWRDTCNNATYYHKMPMLIARQDRRDTLLIIPRAGQITPYGTPTFNPFTRLLVSHVMYAQLYRFDDAVKGIWPFAVKMTFAGYDGKLKPDELARIMGQEPPQAKRVRIKI